MRLDAIALYGQPFSLQDKAPWSDPDQVAETTFTTSRGRTYTVQLEGWRGMLRCGKRDIPMHRYPFTLVRARLLDAQGRPVYQRDMWLLVIGRRRHELSLIEIWEAHRRRHDVEHFFQFGRQRMLLAAYQTPEVENEENCRQIVQLA